jgi:hypothetical protein
MEPVDASHAALGSEFHGGRSLLDDVLADVTRLPSARVAGNVHAVLRRRESALRAHPLNTSSDLVRVHER